MSVHTCTNPLVLENDRWIVTIDQEDPTAQKALRAGFPWLEALEALVEFVMDVTGLSLFDAVAAINRDAEYVTACPQLSRGSRG